jgi:NAD(P)-dependent dehydrogenase (short-subunit alcohol dehydrogenase family)
MPVPYLPVYSTAQHALLGLVRSLAASMDYGRDGVRVNMVATNMLLPSAVETNGGGRTSVQLPTENGEDVGHIVAGLIGNTSADRESHTGEQEEEILHGRILYAMGREAVDVQDGLKISEHVWLGDTGKDAYDRASGNTNVNEAKGRWMLMDALDSPTLF